MERERYVQLLRGDARAAVTADEQVLADALRTSLGALRDADARAFPTSGTGEVLGRAACHRARACLAAWKLEEASQWLAQASHYAPESLDLALTRLHLRVLREAVPGAADEARALGAHAREAQRPHCVIEAATLESLAHEHEGDLDAALVAARKASRMAAAEALPLNEYGANLQLARQRRLAGHPHLAARILVPLLDAAPDGWARAIRWEMWFAGHTEDNVEPWRLVQDGAKAAPTAPAQADFNRLRAMLGLRSHPALHAWCVGASDELPFGLHAISTHARASAYVSIGKGAHRVAGLAERLSKNVLAAVEGQPSRIDTLLSVLALRGDEGLSTAELFRAVYEFTFVQDTHQGALHTLIHRARKRVEGVAEITRSGGVYRLDCPGPLLIPDPRCRTPVFDRALRFIAAAEGGLTAQELARALDIPLRTAQSVLRELSLGESCIRERRGNHVTYRVEDTTFSRVHAGE